MQNPMLPKFNSFICDKAVENGVSSRKVFLVAGRFFDLAPDRWEMLSCEWYHRNGIYELDGDKYLTETMVRYRSVDAMVNEKNFELAEPARLLYNEWVEKRGVILDNDTSKPPIVITPPPPAPPPVVVEPEEPKLEEPKPEKPKKKSMFTFKNIAMIVIGIGIPVSALFPPPYNLIAATVFKILQSVVGG